MSHVLRRLGDWVTGYERRYPEWHHRDNNFTSRRRMDRAHRPILALANAALAGRGGNVLDMGCGNGALLEKIVRANPGTEPYGIDLAPQHVEHARMLHPRHADHFVVGDLIDPSARAALDRRYALVIISAPAFIEAGPARSAPVHAWIWERADQVLFYSYGVARPPYHDFRDRARRSGVVLADWDGVSHASMLARPG